MEFIPYEYALELKKLEFDEPCLGYYSIDYNAFNQTYIGVLKFANDIEYLESQSKMVYILGQNTLLAPTFQQAFKWFRDVHGLYHTIVPEFYRDGINFNWQILWYLPKEKWSERTISGGTMWYGDNGEYPSQEEAELECLKKLIEIINNANKN